MAISPLRYHKAGAGSRSIAARGTARTDSSFFTRREPNMPAAFSKGDRAITIRRRERVRKINHRRIALRSRSPSIFLHERSQSGVIGRIDGQEMAEHRPHRMRDPGIRSDVVLGKPRVLENRHDVVIARNDPDCRQPEGDFGAIDGSFVPQSRVDRIGIGLEPRTVESRMLSPSHVFFATLLRTSDAVAARCG